MALSYDKIVQILKDKNYRLTDIRLSIIKILTDKKHLTLSVIVEYLEKEYQNVNLMSVYNTIDMLLKEHILFSNTFDGKQIWYDLAENPSFHAICDSCKKVLHIKDEAVLKSIDIVSLGKALEKIYWKPIHFKIEGHGLCEECQRLNRTEHTHFDDDLD
ncbi:hypothetical protein P344_06295 [Spiroplasma mirum ATCC 29335]|uniref:Fur family transcriptional regulator n=1 Tax=Spiroplasma mirum ATCC 29335 TaxID=838561 RepID=W0GS11_9MOLU|nr:MULTISPECIES: transcriptional repressor [Spiroplasma]AHF61429.1 putative ferric uptake regulator [Spiroplasma mirum ATCC 29335]AHI58563.1 hypothetical protein P344_06295 [Spiroplasma mirum ATCC 29335]AKM53480.1 Fur family transcriptional regulator [Spiroplasma atrichopogonis]